MAGGALRKSEGIGLSDIDNHCVGGTMEKAKNTVIAALERLIGMLLMVMVIVTISQVFCRYVLGFSLTWSHELVVLLLIWAVWLAVPIGLDRMEHLSVTFFLSQDSQLGGFRLVGLHGALSAFFFGLVFFLSFPVIDAFEGMSLLSLPIPISARYYAAAVGSLCSVLIVKLLLLIKE